MFVYFYRIFDTYNKEITAISVFTDDNKDYKPDRYEYEFYKTELVYKYRTYKILEQREKELEERDNPFALVVLAGLLMIKGKRDMSRIYGFKINLIKLLLTRNYKREKIEKIFIFINALLRLPDELELKIGEEFQKAEGGEDKMGLTLEMIPFVKANYAKGVKDGEKEGKKEGIINLYKKLNMQPESISDVLEVEIEFVKEVLAKEELYREQSE